MALTHCFCSLWILSTAWPMLQSELASLKCKLVSHHTIKNTFDFLNAKCILSLFYLKYPEIFKVGKIRPEKSHSPQQPGPSCSLVLLTHSHFFIICTLVHLAPQSYLTHSHFFSICFPSPMMTFASALLLPKMLFSLLPPNKLGFPFKFHPSHHSHNLFTTP